MSKNSTNLAFDPATKNTIAESLKSFNKAFESNEKLAAEQMKTSESNSESFRRIIEDPKTTFEQKREVKEWMDKEQERQSAIAAESNRQTMEILFLAFTALALFLTTITEVPSLEAGKNKAYSHVLP